MKTGRKLLAIVGIVAVLGMMVVPVAFAQTGTIVLTGGPLAEVPAPITFETFALDGTAHTAVVGSTDAWTAEDPTGTGTGWNLTIAASDFTNANGKTISNSTFEMQLPAETIHLDAGNTAPVEATAFASAAWQPIDQSVKFLTAPATTGMGSYHLTPAFRLDVPAETYAGTYTSTVTVSIISAP